MRKDGHGFLTSLISIIDSDEKKMDMDFLTSLISIIDSDEKRWTWIFDISNIDYRL